MIKPTCSHCRAKNLACNYAYAIQDGTPFRFKAVSFTPRAPPGRTVPPGSSNALEYFCYRGLPVLRCFRSSALWDYLAVQVLSEESVLQDIAVAIGDQQRLIDEPEVGSRICRQRETSYIRAIRSLRKDLDQESSDAHERHALACLLMCLLESLRGSSSNVLIHLKYGIGMMQKQRRPNSGLTNEAMVLLRQHAVHSTTFDALASEKHGLMRSLEPLQNGTARAGAYADPVDGLSTLSIDLMRMMSRRFKMDDTAAQEAAFAKDLAELAASQQELTSAIDTEIATTKPSDVSRGVVLRLAKARCTLVKVYIQSSWSGHQTTYDSNIEDFREIIELISNALHTLSSVKLEHYKPQAFSVGLSVQVMLVKVIQQCRDRQLRRQAFNLFDLCPRHEGVCNDVLAKSLCKAIIDFEERFGAYHISEWQRVHHYTLLSDGGHSRRPVVRFLYRPAEGGSFAMYDQSLATGKDRHWYDAHHPEQDEWRRYMLH